MNQEHKNRLNQLADTIEASPNFRQSVHTRCAVGFAREMYHLETGNELRGLSYEDKGAAEYFGLSLSEFDAIYMANYSELNIGLEDVPDEEFRNITRQTAADVLRRLAARE